MQNLEGSGTPVLYIGRRFLKVNDVGRKQTPAIHVFQWLFLDEFSNFRKATISFAMSICPSARLSVRKEQLGSH